MLDQYRRGDMMAAMNWPAILETLRQRGWTQALLAERLGIAQSAVSDLRRGVTVDPKHSTGEAIRALYDSGDLPPIPEPATAAQGA
jgi:transcriptional regulator with XRE-family HTH domain